MFPMKQNIGTGDRLIRLTLGIALIGFAIWQNSWIAAGFGVFTIYEAIAGWCIYYHLTGQNHCPLTPTNQVPSLSPPAKLALSLALCLSVEFSAAWFTQESIETWYPTLIKPYWTPPNIIFPIAWTVLYLMMAFSLWLITLKEAPNKLGIFFFGCGLFLNFAWSFLFFYLHNPLLAFFDICLLIAAISATIVYFWKDSILAGLLLVPYLFWVIFASTLNLYILLMNNMPL